MTFDHTAVAVAGAITLWNPRHLTPNPANPRGPVVVDDALRDLAESINVHGVLQPLTITASGMLISGHRRREAAIIAGLALVPCLVADGRVDPLVLMLIENLQRIDLTPIQTARACRRLQAGGMTATAIAEAIGKSAVWVNLLLRVLTLPEVVIGEIDRGDLTVNQAAQLIRFAADPALLSALVRDARRGGMSAAAIAALDDRGCRTARPYAGGVVTSDTSAPRPRAAILPASTPTPEELAGNTSIADARVAEASDIAEWVRRQAGIALSPDARAFGYGLAAQIDRGEHHKGGA